MHLPLFFARRYRDASTRFNTVRLINRFAAFVVGVAVCAFFVVLSVFSGLELFGLSFSSALDSDLKIRSVSHSSFLVDDKLEKAVRGVENVESVAPVLKQQVVLRTKSQNAQVTLMGVRDDYAFAVPIESHIALGVWPDFKSNEIVLGYGTASILGLGLYGQDGSLQCMVPKQGKISPTDPQPFRSEEAIVMGVFQLSDDLDYKFAFASESLVRRLSPAGAGMYSELLVKLNDPAAVDGVKEELVRLLGDEYKVLKKSELNPALYQMLQTERLVLYLILSLVLAIALFNVVGAIIMMVLDKINNLKTLVALGAPVHMLRRVFFIQGLLLSVVGGGVGLCVGLVLVAAQYWGGLINVPGTTLGYPVVFSVENMAVLLGVWGGFSAIAAWLASAVVRPRLLN